MDRLSLFHVGTPWISGTVVDAVTGKPVPGMDVCLLVTYAPANFDHRRGSEVKRSVATRTDAAGRFFFERWDDQLDLLDEWEGYGIAVTDPAAQWKDACGKGVYLLEASYPSGGHSDIFRIEADFQSLSDSVAKNPLPYFPVALVKDPSDPHPLPYGLGVSFGRFPDGTLVRKIGNPRNLKIALVPLLRDTNACQSAQDPGSVDLCRQMKQSLIADTLRTSWKISPQGQSPSQ
ncbi:MAG: carboxypeptidase-like regulatory domain-containing protein [Candidatus Sulfotelmatobacter sp.]